MKEFIDKCTSIIQKAYEESPTLEEAEKYAALFLDAQIRVGTELAAASLDARMRKSGTKALKASVLLDAATKGEKKPADSLLTAIVDSDQMVIESQGGLDRAEVTVDELQNYHSVFREAHIFFRGISRGKFE